jgi:alpha-methylacyl-CoA racemase
MDKLVAMDDMEPTVALLEGTRVVELAGLGPAPFACQLLADLGCEIVAIDRPGRSATTPRSMSGNRPVLEIDLRDPANIDAVRALIDEADVLVEGFRPGVTERLGLGPREVRATNPGLVYARMTGWGQTGPLARTAGHDINYIALTGALHHSARAGQIPTPPSNLLGDFGGGGMYLVTAVLAALLRRSRTGLGAVLDVAITDGTTYLTSMMHEYRAHGAWSDEAGTNRLDTGAPFYDVYACSDGGHVAVGALEDPFFAALIELLELGPGWITERSDPARWPQLRSAIADRLATRPRDEWAALSAPTDACLTPVLTLAEAPEHPHIREREVLVPAPQGDGYRPRLPLGCQTDAAQASTLLTSWGVAPATVDALVAGATADT